jgi:hypothetical protein
MPACAFSRLRAAIAVTALSWPRYMAGGTFLRPILAVLGTPRRALLMVRPLCVLSSARNAGGLNQIAGVYSGLLENLLGNAWKFTARRPNPRIG